MRVSVHITTLDRPAELSMLLQSLLRQTFQNFDVVIIDGSKIPVNNFHYVQRTIWQLQKQGHKVIFERAKIIENCKQRLQALEADITNNLLICRVDDDCVLSDNYLLKLHDLIIRGYDAASGITPSAGADSWQRFKTEGSLNDLEFDAEGNITKFGDDCGVDYVDNDLIDEELGGNSFEAKHLRSSFMYKREVHDKGVTYKTPGRVAFREETEFCLRMAWAGYNKFVINTEAKAWHYQSLSGGCRCSDYAEQVKTGDERFKAWAKRTYLKQGSPFEVKE